MGGWRIRWWTTYVTHSTSDILDIHYVNVGQRTLFGPPNHVLDLCHRTRLICLADKCLLADVYVMNVC